ncbi:MAG: prolipoprotein diacylglyceryl transferase [Deltaproteobacteria bacterium RIFOXYA12_FULL_58_15]|nr:MAG: prolipoprotein diacylglyceryl transferase [Deltaproteobacteria bacterium RIFOXYA12_FULL_58_15]OGR14998.1 MAG: prolipoprotein diacylglyceryl transferase [Deltaproteobacteria bacterium RIFOXYB12_FULL_58_9]
MHPVLFDTDLFGILSEPWSLHTYGLLIATGFLLAMTLAARVAKSEGEDPDRVVDMSFYLLLAGLIGARIVFVITKIDDYVRDPIEIVFFWRGGLVFYGAFIGAALFMFYYCRRHRMNFFKFVDIMIPFLALAHAFGRFGCLAAGCCFGKPTDMPWGITFPVNSMAQQAQQSEGLVGIGDLPLAVHPTALYESGFEIGMFWLLTMMRPHKRFHGQVFLVYLAIYPIGRTIIELFRGDRERGVYILSTSQWISILVAATAVALYIYLRRGRGRAEASLDA